MRKSGYKFLRSDDDSALHDHPWWFVSLILRGQYDEVTNDGTARRKVGSIAFRPAERRHRVQLLPYLKQCGGPVQQPDPSQPRRPWIRYWRTAEKPCWTLIITGRRVRTWGFWCRRLVDAWSAETIDELNAVVASTTGQVEVERFVPWTEFVDAGCGEP